MDEDTPGPRGLTFLLPAPELADAEEALAWLEDGALPMLRAVAAGVERTHGGASHAVFGTLLADLIEITGYALHLARGGRAARPALSLQPTEPATFDWASDRLEDALATLALRPGLAPRALTGLALLGAALSRRRSATTDEARAELALPRGE